MEWSVVGACRLHGRLKDSSFLGGATNDSLFAHTDRPQIQFKSEHALIRHVWQVKTCQTKERLIT